MVAFSGTCLVHRAELLKLSGAWHDALTSVRLACERSERATRTPTAAAFYEQGEIHRLRGDFAAAEDAYRSASRVGCDSQPGLSLLLAAQGRTSAARASIRRAVEASTDRFQRARLLPAAVDIALGAGDIEAAGHDESGPPLRRYRKQLDAPPKPVVVRDDLPNPNHGHTWKFIALDPTTCSTCRSVRRATSARRLR